MSQTLLLADDSVTIQRVIELTFADEPITVVAVSDGDQAIDRIEAEPPDIVLVDIGMPGRTGYEVAQHIKESPRLRHIPVLLLTGAFEPVDQARAAAARCDGVLAKPFEPHLVIGRVKELLGLAAEVPSAVPTIATPAAVASDVWGLPPEEPKPEPPRSAQAARLDDYFDRLDVAFQTLGDRAPADQQKPAAEPTPVREVDPTPVKEAEPSPVREMIDWFANAISTPAERNSDPLPATASAAPPVPELTPEPPPREYAWHPEPFRERAEPMMAVATPQISGAAVGLPPIADAFSAILASEQHEPMPFLTAWPAAPASSNGSAAIGEDVIEEITRRVLDRLSDGDVRQAVADVISRVAERLIREEIDRIKSSIR
jgi:CheY-like chemotaxis protein